MKRRLAFTLTAAAAVAALIAVGQAAIADPGHDKPTNHELQLDELPSSLRSNADFAIALEPLADAFPDVYAGRQFDEDTRTVNVGYFSEADPQRIDELSSAVKALPLGNEITVELVTRDFALAKLQAAAEDIASNPAAWVSFFGATVTSLEIDEVSGVVYVGSDDAGLSGSTFKHSDGIVFVAGGNAGSVEFQSRISDTSPWTG